MRWVGLTLCLALIGGAADAQPTDNDLLAAFCIGAARGFEAGASQGPMGDAAEMKAVTEHNVARYRDYLAARGWLGPVRPPLSGLLIAMNRGEASGRACAIYGNLPLYEGKGSPDDPPSCREIDKCWRADNGLPF
jgi:hypothetical protein